MSKNLVLPTGEGIAFLGGMPIGAVQEVYEPEDGRYRWMFTCYECGEDYESLEGFENTIIDHLQHFHGETVDTVRTIGRERRDINLLAISEDYRKTAMWIKEEGLLDDDREDCKQIAYPDIKRLAYQWDYDYQRVPVAGTDRIPLSYGKDFNHGYRKRYPGD